jgi:hypothetical protein
MQRSLMENVPCFGLVRLGQYASLRTQLTKRHSSNKTPAAVNAFTPSAIMVIIVVVVTVMMAVTILGGRLPRLSSGRRECFHSIQYSANGERPARA